MTASSRYKDSGVDIDTGNALVDAIKPLALQTKRKEVISGIGGFAGLFSLADCNVPNPVLVATTDGVGTKLKLALEMNHLDSLGQDLVAMCVNDLICCGAEPLFFLDYFATGALQLNQASLLLRSISETLKKINCTLLGGETAEMPGLYHNNDFDIAGFAVGVVDKNKIIDGKNVQPGHQIIGIASSGIHSNGYSLVRNIIRQNNLDLNTRYFSDQPLGLELLKPTHVYVNPVLHLIKNFEIMAMAHITGGGLLENIPRVIPSHLRCTLKAQSIKTPEVFRFLQKQGNISEDEMRRVFNMGIGFILVTKPEDTNRIIKQISDMNLSASVIGTLTIKEQHHGAVEFI